MLTLFEHTERHTGKIFKHQGEKNKAKHVVVQFLCVLSVRLKRCILDDFGTLDEIFYTTQLLNPGFLLISGIEFDMSFVHHTFLKVGKF